MAHLIETYHDEWAEVVKDPERRAAPRQVQAIRQHRRDYLQRKYD